MTYAGSIESPFSDVSSRRPFIASYDLGYEYSQQHYIAVECMVENADEEASFANAPRREAVAV